MGISEGADFGHGLVDCVDDALQFRSFGAGQKLLHDDGAVLFQLPARLLHADPSYRQQSGTSIAIRIAAFHRL